MNSPTVIVATLVVFSIFQLGHCATLPQQEGAPRKVQYYLSRQPATWSDANETGCQSIDPTAHLVKIETQGELADVRDFIARHGSPQTKYWTGGIYDPASRDFMWDIRDGPKLLYPAPWDSGYPNQLNSFTRLVVIQRANMKFQTSIQSDCLHYICESYCIGDC